MLLEQVKIGTRVKFTGEVQSIFNIYIKTGKLGTIVENDRYCPYVAWDNFHKGHDGCGNVSENFINEGRDNIWAESISNLETVEE